MSHEGPPSTDESAAGASTAAVSPNKSTARRVTSVEVSFAVSVTGAGVDGAAGASAGFVLGAACCATTVVSRTGTFATAGPLIVLGVVPAQAAAKKMADGARSRRFMMSTEVEGREPALNPVV